MFKFVVLSVFAALVCVSAAPAPGGLVVPVAPAVAVAHPIGVARSYQHSYTAPVVKAVPVVHAVHAAPIVHAAHPVVATPLIAHSIKTSQQVIAHPSPLVVKTPIIAHPAPIAVGHVGAPAVAVAPALHSVPVAGLVAHRGLPVTHYVDHYNQPLVKSHHVVAPVTLVH